MIAGIGLDTVEIARLEDKIARHGHFAEKIFSAKEIEYCNQNKNPAQHYAVRFAAKEAFLKAAGVGLNYSFELAEIEVVNDDSGRPELYLSGDFEMLKNKNGWTAIHVSLTHSNTEATAIVIIER